MTTNTDPTNTFIGYDELKQHGILYSKGWLNALIRDEKFPQSIVLSRKRRMWRLVAIPQYIADKEAAPPVRQPVPSNFKTTRHKKTPRARFSQP